MKFVQCLLFLAVLSFTSFLLGRVLPKSWFRHDSFMFKSFPVEKNGMLYQKLAIQRWKNQLPDMSIFFHRWMPSKTLSKQLTQGHLELMIAETCIAEFIHALLGALGFFCMVIWKSRGGVVVSLLYALGNLPFCLVQRYNRPKLVKLLRRIKKRNPEECYCEPAELAVQYE